MLLTLSSIDNPLGISALIILAFASNSIQYVGHDGLSHKDSYMVKYRPFTTDSYLLFPKA